MREDLILARRWRQDSVLPGQKGNQTKTERKLAKIDRGVALFALKFSLFVPFHEPSSMVRSVAGCCSLSSLLSEISATYPESVKNKKHRGEWLNFPRKRAIDKSGLKVESPLLFVEKLCRKTWGVFYPRFLPNLSWKMVLIISIRIFGLIGKLPVTAVPDFEHSVPPNHYFKICERNLL